jgi:hypothetical protein
MPIAILADIISFNKIISTLIITLFISLITISLNA